MSHWGNSSGFANDAEFLAAWERWGRGTVAEQLKELVAGDSCEIVIVPAIPALRTGTSRTITKAWLSIKAKQTDADPTENAAWSPTAGARQSISTTEVSGRGWIINSGEAGGELRFDLTAANTALLTPQQTYYFDVQVLMSDGALYTIERGTLNLRRQITVASS